LGIALVARTAAAQDVSCAYKAARPLVGPWIIDRKIDTGAEPPVVVVTADGGFFEV